MTMVILSLSTLKQPTHYTTELVPTNLLQIEPQPLMNVNLMKYFNTSFSKISQEMTMTIIITSWTLNTLNQKISDMLLNLVLTIAQLESQFPWLQFLLGSWLLFS